MKLSKRLLYLPLVFSSLLFLGGFNGCEKNFSTFFSVDDYVHHTSKWARVIEVESERSLIVEVVAPEWWAYYSPEDYDNDERNDGGEDGFVSFLVGDTVRVVYAEDNAWIGNVIKNKVDVGAIIEFCVLTGDVADLSKNPFEVPSTGILIYEEGNDTVSDGIVIFKGLHKIFERVD